MGDVPFVNELETLVGNQFISKHVAFFNHSSNITFHTNPDNTGADECELRIWADSAFQSHRRDMNNGDVWDLNIPLEFQQRVKIQLYDLDNPGPPLYDDHDHLGTLIIRPDQPEGSGTFNQDGADYHLDWVAG